MGERGWSGEKGTGFVLEGQGCLYFRAIKLRSRHVSMISLEWVNAVGGPFYRSSVQRVRNPPLPADFRSFAMPIANSSPQNDPANELCRPRTVTSSALGSSCPRN